MTEFIELILMVGAPLVFLLVGGAAGTVAERRHTRSLATREKSLAAIRVDERDVFRAGQPARADAVLVVAEVVIASDYLKTFLASLRTLVGGEVQSFAKLLGRGRREAIIRLQEQARAQGRDAVCNVRLTTSQIGKIMCAIQASGTAYSVLDEP